MQRSAQAVIHSHQVRSFSATFPTPQLYRLDLKRTFTPIFIKIGSRETELEWPRIEGTGFPKRVKKYAISDKHYDTPTLLLRDKGITVRKLSKTWG